MWKFRLIGDGVGLALALLIVTLVAIFGAGGSANAQSAEDVFEAEDITRVHLQLIDNDTCWELAERFAGSGIYCRELVEANPDQLTWAGGDDPGLRSGSWLWLPPSWIPGFWAEMRRDRTNWFVPYVRSGTDLGGINTVELPSESFVDSNPIVIGSLGGAFQQDPEHHHDCSGWNPSDLGCDGGDNTVKLLLGIAIVLFIGTVVWNQDDRIRRLF